MGMTPCGPSAVYRASATCPSLRSRPKPCQAIGTSVSRPAPRITSPNLWIPSNCWHAFGRQLLDAEGVGGLMQELSTSSVLLVDSQTVDSALKANILLVDDSPTKLLALESALASLGQNLLTARSAEEALRYLLAQDCAVIVLDVNMPGMNGFELAELIRRRERSQHTPIIFISAISPTETHAFKGYELGAVDYIYTPTPEVLQAKVAVFADLFKKTAESKRYATALRLLKAQLDQRAADGPTGL